MIISISVGGIAAVPDYFHLYSQDVFPTQGRHPYDSAHYITVYG